MNVILVKARRRIEGEGELSHKTIRVARVVQD